MRSIRADHYIRRKKGKADLALWGKGKVKEDEKQRRENYRRIVNTGNK